MHVWKFIDMKVKMHIHGANSIDETIDATVDKRPGLQPGVHVSMN